jgi:hypothetical protein
VRDGETNEAAKKTLKNIGTQNKFKRLLYKRFLSFLLKN